MQAFAPIAVKVFGNHNISIGIRLSFLSSLVLSRMLFNAHVAVLHVSHLTLFNGAYMRVLRRITNKMRFERCDMTDHAIRKSLNAPSVDCIIQRNRLLYLRRLLINKPRVLLAALHFQFKGRRLPWVELILEDLRRVKKDLRCCSSLGDPAVDIEAWTTTITSHLWPSIVYLLHYTGSVSDRSSVRSSEKLFSCDICSCGNEASVVSFATQKALLAHNRTKHKTRIQHRFYVDADGICPACNTRFETRLRCIRHLSDARRTKCWVKIVSTNIPPLSSDRVMELDLLDRVARTEAHRAGHSHPIAVGSARTAAGKRIGSVSW